MSFEEKQNNRSIGTRYEGLAEDYLRKQGCEIIEKNFRCRSGEIDIIFRDGDYLVFGEVKYRRTDEKALPQDAVNSRKQYKICRVSDFYRQSHHLSDEIYMRYDVIAILGDEITWYRNAFSYVYCKR